MQRNFTGFYQTHSYESAIARGCWQRQNPCGSRCHICRFSKWIASVLMAPTEILATQHASTLQKMLEPFGVQTALLTGGMRVVQKRETLAAIASGQANLVVGTHAVLSDGVEFSNLAVAITDEQHRFGVRQRQILAQKGKTPHLLVMSATPSLAPWHCCFMENWIFRYWMNFLRTHSRENLFHHLQKTWDMFGFWNSKLHRADRYIWYALSLKKKKTPPHS